MVLPVRSPLISGILTLYQTFLLVDKKLWLLLISIGNILLHIRIKPTELAWILIGLLPVRPKRSKGIKEFTIQNALTVQHEVLGNILCPLVHLYEVCRNNG